MLKILFGSLAVSLLILMLSTVLVSAIGFSVLSIVWVYTTAGIYHALLWCVFQVVLYTFALVGSAYAISSGSKMTPA